MKLLSPAGFLEAGTTAAEMGKLGCLHDTFILKQLCWCEDNQRDLCSHAHSALLSVIVCTQ